MRSHIGSIVAALVACSGCATAGGRPPAAEYAPRAGGTTADQQQSARADSSAEAPLCPVDIRGTTVSVALLEDGAALLFVGPRDAKQVSELRRRVRSLARTQNRAARLPPGEASPSAVQAAAESGLSREPTATVSDIDRGAMLRFTPSELDQLADVQGNVIEYAQRLAGGSCPLTRDDLSLLPADRGRSGAEPYVVPMPSGIIPNAGGFQSTTTMPSLGVWF